MSVSRNLGHKIILNEEHVHTNIFVRPNLANGATITKAGGSWSAYSATPTELIAVDDIIGPYDLHFLSVSSISENGEFQLQLYTGESGSEIPLGDGYAISRSAVQSQEGTRKIQSIVIPPGTRISVALTGSPVGASTVVIKVEGHVY